MSNQNLPATQQPSLGGLLKMPENRVVLQRLLAADEKGLERFIAVAFQTVMRAPHLKKCDPFSLIMAIKDAAALKLSVDGPLGQAWIVPYKKNVKNPDGSWSKLEQAQMQLGYKGVIALAMRAGSVLSIDADVVWAWDKYRLTKGSDSRLEVESMPPPPDADMSNIDNIVLAYAVAHLRGGTKKLYVLWNKQILESRNRSQGYRSALEYNKTDSPWMLHPAAMAAKTAIHRLGKQLELSADDMRALIADEAREEGRVQDVPASVTPMTHGGEIDLDTLLDSDPDAPPSEDEMRRSDAKHDVSKAEVKVARDPKGGGKLFRSDEQGDPA